jgi:hypothetical protein
MTSCYLRVTKRLLELAVPQKNPSRLRANFGRQHITMLLRKRWLCFRVQGEDGEAHDYELDERGRLKDPPARQTRRRHPFTADPQLQEAPRLRMARIVNAPPPPYVGRAADDGGGSTPLHGRDCCPTDEAYPGPYAGCADEGLFNDDFSPGYGEEDFLFTPYDF